MVAMRVGMNFVDLQGVAVHDEWSEMKGACPFGLIEQCISCRYIGMSNTATSV